MRRPSLGFVLLALVCVPLPIFSTHVADPWLELQRLSAGLLTPDIPVVGDSVSPFSTLAFAIQGVALRVLLGFLLGLPGHSFTSASNVAIGA